MPKISAKQIDELYSSGYFDPDWYIQRYPDVSASGMDAAEHYIWLGAKLGRLPGPGTGRVRSGPTRSAAARPHPTNRDVSRLSDEMPLPVLPSRPSRWIQNTAAILRNRSRPLEPLTRSFNPTSMNLHWIVPDFLAGGGGHMSIFRMVRLLELFGHRQTIWIQNPDPQVSEQQTYERIREWYQPIDKVIVRFLPEDVEGISGDAVIATDMWTPFPASNMPLFKERFYLVQDYEALFHIHGTYSYLADHSYQMGFKVVCAGVWLRQLMERRFGLWARDWDLAYDPTHYFPPTRPKALDAAPPRIAFYARQSTPRRAVELGREALAILHERGVAFSVDLFGQNNLGAPPLYDHVHHGLLTPKQLGELYRAADVGLVFSATNYSLIPIEMMACGLPVVELDTESTRAVFPDSAVAFAAPNPHSIADTLATLIQNRRMRDALREGGKRYVEPLSWENSARALESALVEGLSESNEAVTPETLFRADRYRCKAAVIIPTWNAGAFFREVLRAVTDQQTSWPFDVLVVDSGSTDDTLSIVQEYSNRGVRLHTIPNIGFQHGRTRNLAVSLTDAEFVAVITQDAKPVNQQWLANLVTSFDASPRIAGVFGAHVAHPDASGFVRDGLAAHFRRFEVLPHVAGWSLADVAGAAFGSQSWQQWLHYYSDNNSCMRRSVWEKIPYPEIPWGEDQVWAWEVIKQGYEKAYAPNAIVAHSHNHTIAEQAKVSRIEGDFWLRYFGYRFEVAPAQVKASIDYLNKRDISAAKVTEVAPEILAHQLKLNSISVIERYLGQYNLLTELRRYHF